ncbi:MAG: MBL fold metallo-hydrolase [Spirulinaceae cyanobacterium RM2_2_10]|nr:MBL fold metallo-hydrolase [Spirulinaceae cyanobacterium SM2_1_0]NJO19887.1 MBL fold metallo-hydrolase [Spirulinaceae cyanobacterium RM2_2_10]
MKQPRQILPGIFAFPPNRDALGGTAYLIVENQGNILIDCPAWHQETQHFLRDRGPLRELVLTHRDGGRAGIAPLQAEFGCSVRVQEQEAYLLPECRVETFGAGDEITPDCQVIWTPGYSPGSSCVYLDRHGGILFSGRHLLPDQNGQLTLRRRPKTFHWWRQLASTAALRDRFSPETLYYLCPGANTGLLRGTGAIAAAGTALQQLDLSNLAG